MNKAKLSVSSQELHFDESIRAIETFADDPEQDNLTARIAGLLPHSSETTRLRLASSIAQRFFKAADRKWRALPFLKLVKSLQSESARRDLLYWRTARTEKIVAATARDIFYPYFVLNTLPQGYDEHSFRMANTATLFTVDRVISRDFAIEYARRMWNFDSARTITLALRIMRQANILDAISVKLGRRHVLGYYPQPHSLRPEVFAYCMFEEFLHSESLSPLSLDRVQTGDCARLFFLTQLQVDSLLKSLERMKLISHIRLRGGKHIRFISPDLGTLVDALTHNLAAKNM